MKPNGKNFLMLKTLLILASVLSFTTIVLAQQAQELQRKNIIKIEITHAVYPHSLVMSYERITKPNQSFCFTGGYEEFPPIVNISSTTSVRQDLKKHGFKVGAEYRFYLRSENRHLAPHGTYIGPYVSYHDFYNKRDIEVDVDGIKENAELETDFMITNVGFQLGHQFVFGDRWTLDVVAIGPSISNYHAKLKLNGDFTFDKDEVQSEIFLKILDRFPMLEDVLTDKEVSDNGKFDSWSFGWRAQLHVGYYFGSKRKK